MITNVESALLASKRAITFDVSKNYEAAIYFYKEAAKFLYLAVLNETCPDEEKEEWRDKIKQYEARAATLADTSRLRRQNNVVSL